MVVLVNKDGKRQFRVVRKYSCEGKHLFTFRKERRKEGKIQHTESLFLNQRLPSVRLLSLQHQSHSILNMVIFSRGERTTVLHIQTLAAVLSIREIFFHFNKYFWIFVCLAFLKVKGKESKFPKPRNISC